MKRSYLTLLLFVPAMLPLISYAKPLMVGSYAIEYDEKIEADINGNGVNDRTSYYKGGLLVWTAYDENEDGKADLWLRFKNGDTVDLELVDKNGDGEPNIITEVGANEKAEMIFDESIGGGSSSWWSYVAVVLAIGAVAYVIKKKPHYLQKLGVKNIFRGHE